MKKKVNKISLVFILLIIIFALFLLLDFTGFPGGEEVSITVESGESFSSVVDKMTDESVIRFGFLFERYAIGTRADVELKSGTHIMRENMGYVKAA